MTKHGAPDWSRYRRSSSTFSLEDLAEHAVRLGSIVSYDRRGDVVFLEDFEHGLLHVATTTSGTGGTITIDPTISKTGGYSAKLVAGSDDDKAAQIQILLATPPLPRVGIEFSWSRCKDDTLIQLSSSLYTDAGVISTLIRYYPGTNTLQYRDSDLNMQDLDTDLNLHDADNFFHTLKLVADFNTRFYSRLLINDQIYNLSSYALRATTVPSNPLYFATIQLSHTTATNPHIFVDDIIATQDEP